ncbi:MAG: hypothetical protein MUO23_06620 [Anaerolineales bacterium]|nr:hypothetical protein [Anaerolineales bacterium]
MIAVTQAERGFLMLGDRQQGLRFQVAQGIEQQLIDTSLIPHEAPVVSGFKLGALLRSA